MVTINKKKSEILKFYISIHNEEIKLLSNDDISKLQLLYDEINFNYINKTYMENENGELDNLLLAFESEDDDF